MWVSARALAMECNVSERTIRAHVNQMEQDGYMVRSKIGRPMRINRESFLRRMFPGWTEGEEICGKSE